MKKTRKAHLWIGLICSIFILLESITGLFMNEPWLIGQSQAEGRGNFGAAPFNQGGSPTVPSQVGQQNQEQNQLNSQNQATNQNQSNSQTQGQSKNQINDQFPGSGTFAGNAGGLRGDGASNGSLMGIIKGLHEGKIGTANIKWITDLAALAMIFLTATGIYLSTKVLISDKKRQRRKMKEAVVIEGN